MKLEILYQDEYLVAINKPAGLLVHRTPMARDAKVFALQELRNQLDRYVYPAHRLDRKTSGVLLFSFSPEVDALMKKQFENREPNKTYWTIVRGYTPEEGVIEKPLAKDNGELQDALTRYRKLKQVQLDIPVSKYPTTRLSFLEVKPETGRMHQIRKHMAHIRHYIIGDKPHGDCKINKVFEEKLELFNMLLHAKELSFTHPITKKEITIEASIPEHFEKVLEMFK